MLNLLKSKTAIKYSMTFLLILAIAFPFFALQYNGTAEAATLNLKLYPEIAVTPNPVGIGQQTDIIIGFTFPTATAFVKGYTGWTITVTRPDNTTFTLGPLNSDSTGYCFTSFIPDQLGTWKFQAHYPGGTVDYVGATNSTIPAADTSVFSITVQSEQVPYYQGAALPSEYWTFPINAENREWYQLAGNWYSMGGQSGGRYGISGLAKNYYTTIPTAGHILWAKPDLFGGVIGGETQNTYYDGSSYRPSMLPPVVINGKLYYNMEAMPKMGFYCVDLATGETLWYNNASFPDGKGGTISGANAQLTAGQVLNLDTMNWHGGFPYLWSTKTTTWAMWDAFSGQLYCTFINAPARPTSAQGVTLYIDPETGTIFTYQLDTTTKTLVLWNSTRCLEKSNLFDVGIVRLCFDTAQHFNIDWKLGIQWNVSLPQINNVGNTLSNGGFIVDQTDYSRIVLTNHSRANPLLVTNFTDICISGLDGSVLWTKTRSVTDGTWEEVSGGDDMSVEQNAYILLRKETKQVYAYSLSTGDQLWVSEPRDNLWSTFMRGPAIAYDKVIVDSYDGEVWAYNVTNGQILWKWGPVKSGLETPYGQYPFIGGITIADNKIVVSTNEHSGDTPLYRGERMYVIDLNTGETLWSSLGWYQIPAVANGYVLGLNQYDGRIYAFGKGPSAISVSTPDIDVTLGQGLTIKGTVTDISAGTKQTEQASRFPNGVPAVSDSSMDSWMEYIYSQKPKPTNTTGVDITLSVIDSNNNLREIGTTTSNADGFFTYHWIPDISGTYTLYATFNGSNSFYGSHAVTAFTVIGPEATSSPQPVTVPSMADLYFMPMSIVLLIAIVVVGAVIVLALKRRP
jgi:hypothetical protein